MAPPRRLCRRHSQRNVKTRDSKSPERSEQHLKGNAFQPSKEFPGREDLIKCWARTLGKSPPLNFGPGDCFYLAPDWEGGVEFDKQGMSWNPRNRSKEPASQAGVDRGPSLTQYTCFYSARGCFSHRIPGP